MLIKAGVDISRLKPPIRKKLPLIAQHYRRRCEELTVTSTYEGNHSEGSLHYAHLAVDTEMPLKGQKAFVEDLAEELGPDYDVVLEKYHIHTEYDPK
jgi:hypothetical protein